MDKSIFNGLMLKYGKKINIMFTDKHLDMFFDYMNLLIEWNENINLTAIINPEDIIIKHFIDSLTINKYIDKNSTLVDVGTGAGFPGIPLKIYRDDLDITLVDSLNKRICFLNEVINELKLENIQTVHTRVENFANDKCYREHFDFVTARAVANLNVLSEYLIPLVKICGKCICMKGNDVEQEKKESENAVKILGGKIENIEYFNLADTDYGRSIILINKVCSTPNKYPRKAGLPSKEPLR